MRRRSANSRSLSRSADPVLSKNPIDAVRRADATLDARRVATFVTAESLCSARPVCRLFPTCCSSSSWPSRAGSTSSRVTSLTLSRKSIASAESRSVLAGSGSPTPSDVCLLTEARGALDQGEECLSSIKLTVSIILPPIGVARCHWWVALLHGATRQGWSKGSDDAVMS